jgi:hypothetical protein
LFNYGAYVISGDSNTIFDGYPALVDLDEEHEWGELMGMGLEIESVEKQVVTV